jgi:uncharacterized membrane protein required for colicin V production
MNNIDIAILVVWGLAAFNGWRRGLVVSLFSITGAAIGAYFGHGFIAKFAHASQPDMIKVGIILGGLVLSASIGSSIGSFSGRRLRSVYKWTPLGLVDNFGGLILSLIIWIIVVWLAFHIVAEVPNWKLGIKLHHSHILKVMNANMPSFVVNFIDSVFKPQDLIDQLWTRIRLN